VSLPRPRHAPSRGHRAATRFDATADRQLVDVSTSKFGSERADGLKRARRASAAKARRARAKEIFIVGARERLGRRARRWRRDRARGAQSLLSRTRRLLCDAARAVRRTHHDAMPTTYAETFWFDLVVVFLICVVMPLGVLLLQSRRSQKRVVALTLLLLAAAWIGLFEHARMRRPEITRAGVRNALRTVRDVDGRDGRFSRAALERALAEGRALAPANASASSAFASDASSTPRRLLERHRARRARSNV
jgi:hypothetical protein